MSGWGNTLADITKLLTERNRLRQALAWTNLELGVLLEKHGGAGTAWQLYDTNKLLLGQVKEDTNA
jgi:hypothetical protein